MPCAIDLIQIHFNGARFILAWTTVNAYPNSLLAEKVKSLEPACKDIKIDRDAGQFKLIKQLMIYKERTRRADILAADRKKLLEELEFYRLNELFMYVVSWRKQIIKPEEWIISYLLCKESDKWTSLEPLIRRPTIFMCADFSFIASKFDKFNYKRYDVLFETSKPFIMSYYENRGTRSLAVSLGAKSSREEENRVFFLFLLAVERYDSKHGTLVGRKFFKERLGCDILDEESVVKNLNDNHLDPERIAKCYECGLELVCDSHGGEFRVSQL